MSEVVPLMSASRKKTVREPRRGAARPRDATKAVPGSKPRVTLQSRFWLTCDGQSLAGRGRIELLRRIGETGSIRQAAIAMGMSYRAAWDAVDAMNQRAGRQLVARHTGGSHGGGAVLSEAGLRLLAVFAQLEDQHARLVGELERLIGDPFSS